MDIMACTNRSKGNCTSARHTGSGDQTAVVTSELLVIKSNEFVTVSPSIAKFAHDSSSKQSVKVVIRNKYAQSVFLMIQEPPTTCVFQATLEKKHLYPGEATSIMIQCNPFEEKHCSDSIKLKIVLDSMKEHKESFVTIPLQMYPSSPWFVLPKTIWLPKTPLGESVTATIALPRPDLTQPYFVTVDTSLNENFQVHPKHGVIGSLNGVKEFHITYTPKTYTTQTYKIHMNFPDTEMPPYEIVVYARSAPGLEREKILQKVQEIQKLTPNLEKKKAVEPRLKLKTSKKFLSEATSEPIKKEIDLCTAGGVLKFLVQKDKISQHLASRTDALGVPVGQDRIEYKKKEKEFHEKIVRAAIHQKNIAVQHHKTFLGLDLNDVDFKKLEDERDSQIKEYQELLSSCNNPDNSTRQTPVLVNQQMIRTVGDDLAVKKPHYDLTRITRIYSESQKVVQRELLHRFIQAALIIITRKRAAKRLIKLKWLVYEIKNRPGSFSKDHIMNKPRQSFHVEMVNEDLKGHAIMNVVENAMDRKIELLLQQQKEKELREQMENKATKNNLKSKHSLKLKGKKSPRLLNNTPKARGKGKILKKEGIEYLKTDEGKGESKIPVKDIANNDEGREMIKNISGGDSF